MDYLTPLASAADARSRSSCRSGSLDQFVRTLADVGLRAPLVLGQFVESIDVYHHMVYASAYTYRATVWFDFALPGPDERAWLR